MITHSWRSWTLCCIQCPDETASGLSWEEVNYVLRKRVSLISFLSRNKYLVTWSLQLDLCDDSGQRNDRENDVNLSQIGF